MLNLDEEGAIPCGLVKEIYLEKEGLTFLQNTTTFLPDYKVMHPTRPQYSS